MPYIHMPFPLDQWVSRFHKRIGINTPEDITEKAMQVHLVHFTCSDKRRFYRSKR
jgi:hypothetical protein